MPKKNNDQQSNLEQINQLLTQIDNNTQKIRDLLFDKQYQQSAQKLADDSKSADIVEGIFDGYQMVTSTGEKYQVPENYASKSKLVEGDVLKLTISSDGSYIFKQIGPIERKKVIGELGLQSGKYFVKSDDKKYNVLTASITYFKAKPGDKLTVVIPKNKESQWASIENVIGS